MNVLAKTAAVLTLSAAGAVLLAAPASALPHLDHESSAHCMGWAVSIGAVTGGPGAVADHLGGVRAVVGTDFGRLTASVAAEPSCS